MGRRLDEIGMRASGSADDHGIDGGVGEECVDVGQRLGLAAEAIREPLGGAGCRVRDSGEASAGEAVSEGCAVEGAHTAGADETYIDHDASP
jgi:hypothetical protein